MIDILRMLSNTLLPVPLHLLPKPRINLRRLPRLHIRIKHQINLLQRPLCRLWIQEEHMEGHYGTEHTEDDVCLPLDIRKRGSNEVRQRKVKNPITRCTESHALGSVLEREDFRRVDPCRRRPGETVHGDEDVGERDDGLSWGPGDFPL